MKQGSRSMRATLVGQTLEVFREGIAPVIWQKRRCDIHGYLRVQNGEPDRLSSSDFNEVGRVGIAGSEPNRRFVNDPQNALKVLWNSTPIREETLDGDPVWLEHISKLWDVRNLWAHLEPISRQRLNEAFESAGQLLRGAEASRQAEQIEALKHHVDSGLVREPLDAVRAAEELLREPR